MKEDLNLLSDEYNLFTTYWTVGYIVGMIPSQIAISRIRPSIWIPAAEVLWAILTFCFAAVKNEKQVYAMRFLIGLFEAPFYVGAMTLLGNWYTPVELGKRASIFYSASFAANMFSGYLQAAVYKGLDGTHGLAGWRWLFIMCGIITVPGALWGFFAVPDSPYKTKVWYLKKEDIELAKSRMVKLDRRPFKGIGFATFKKVLLNPWALIFIVNCKFPIISKQCMVG
jgi:ACS family pantothenate transporter-like MFS transporter